MADRLPPDLKELIRSQRVSKGLTQDQLAVKVGTKQQTIEKIENGTIKHSSFLPQILTELGLSLALLTPDSKKPTRLSADPQPLVGALDLPVYGAAEGGHGALILSTDPVEYVARPQPLFSVKNAYGIIVVEDSMAPEFERGDVALVHPHIPPAAGHTCIFYAKDVDGAVRAIIKRLRRSTADSWHVKQWNPGDDEPSEFTLSKKEWQECHVTVGRFSRR